MRHSLIVIAIAFCLGSANWAQIASADGADQSAAVEFAQEAVPRALNYDQGKRESLTDAQQDFTPDGWREFMKWLTGYVDDKGAPTGSSLFTATGDA
ncbi:MAG TPA: hypothetical protein VNM47_01010, partial [Terriglobia bacterium]|nr:hypothetical protein [Terriglobia bacterium]